MDDLTRKRPEDSSKININQDWEVYYWCKKFGVDPKILKKAVHAVGPMVSDVVKWFKQRGHM